MKQSVRRLSISESILPQLVLPLREGAAQISQAADANIGRRHVIAGLFAGIGGIELGLHRAGHNTALLCENDPAAVCVLRNRFPGVRIHEDVRTLERLPQNATLVTAGFPCQDLSQAGMTKGIRGGRSGLVSEVFRLLENQKVPLVLLENVPFMLQLGRGTAMRFVTAELEQLGYRWAYRVVDARAFGLPQRRRRVYLVASRTIDPRAILFADDLDVPDNYDFERDGVACGFYWTEGLRGLGWAIDAVPTLKGGSTIGIPSPPAILLSDRRVVTPSVTDAERLQGFPKNWTKPAEEVSRSSIRWKLVGNAVNVRAAEWIGRRLIRPKRPLNLKSFSFDQSKAWPTAAWNVGAGCVRVDVSEWPVRREYKSLETFLRGELRPLSARATRGFLSRARVAKLNFPDGFLSALDAHLELVSAKERRLNRLRRSEKR